MLWLLTAALAGTPVADDSVIDRNPDAPVAVRFRAHIGALATLDHSLQIGLDGTGVSVPADLGQNVLYPYLRFQVDLDIGKKDRRNTLSFLYQPLTLASTVAPDRDLAVGDVTYGEGRSLDFSYGFNFWRLSWLHDVAKSMDKELAVGLALQIRNANIVYAPRSGETSVAVRDVGPVPLLAFRGRGTLTRRLWMAGEVQGFYAPIRVLNGGAADVVGAFVDTSVSLGLAGPGGADLMFTLRYLGGGSTGQSSNPDPFTDGFLENWLHAMTLSVGIGLR